MTRARIKVDDSRHDTDILVKASSPDIYRLNAFRIMRVRVDATNRTVKRQLQRLKIMEKIGDGHQQQPGLLALAPPADGDTVREAMQRLRDPQRRLVDEFFWFWPKHFGDSCEGHDRALAALERGDVDAARTSWIGAGHAQHDGQVALHNLAVLAHASALDLEHKARTDVLTPREVQKRDLLWPQAFEHWERLLHSDDFWDRLADRIRRLDDPRLTTRTALKMRQSLPLSLLLINAQLAARSAETDDHADATRHVRLVRESGFGHRWIEESLDRATGTARDRIKTVCRSAEERAAADSTRGDEVARQLIDQTRPLLSTLDRLLPEEDEVRRGAHDQVALQILSCQVNYGNETEDWRRCIEILDAAKETAVGMVAQARVGDNLRIVRANLDHQEMYATCFFCSDSPPDDEAAIELKIHGDVTREPVMGGTRIRWRGQTFQVPRCTRCQQDHNKMAALTGFGGLMGSLAGLGSCVAMTSADSDLGCAALGVLVGLAVAGSAVGWLIGRAVVRQGLRPQEDASDFPPVKELLDQGWTLGEKPSDAQ